MTATGEWVLVENPAYAGMSPRPMIATCHDGSPFVTIRCRCGSEFHQHESRVAHVPADAEIASRCFGCGELLVFPPGWFAAVFDQLRSEGWTAEGHNDRTT
jgi:hypothetical protein